MQTKQFLKSSSKFLLRIGAPVVILSGVTYLVCFLFHWDYPMGMMLAGSISAMLGGFSLSNATRLSGTHSVIPLDPATQTQVMLTNRLENTPFPVNAILVGVCLIAIGIIVGS